MAQADPSPPILPDRLWHHRVHAVLGERLHFWRLSFQGTYPRDSVRAGLKAALASCQVRSVAVYEMLGIHDLLIRVWLPQGCHPLAFHDAMIHELDPHGLATCEVFAVDYTVRHWAFDDSPKEPSDQAVHSLLDDPDLKKIDRGDLTHTQGRHLTEEGVLAVPPIARSDAGPGIKFAVVICGGSRDTQSDSVLDTQDGAPAHTLSPDDRRALERRVTEIVGEATSIAQRSLYAGSGFGHFLVLGRVDYTSFHDINSKLVSQLVSAPIREEFSASTTTMISGQRGLRLFSEALTRCPFVELTTSGPQANGHVDWRKLPVGAMFADDRFEVLESLGEGGFGVVYRVCDHRENGVHRALKLFAPEGSAAAQRELSMLRKVSHENVVEMFWGDRESQTRCWYLVSEFVEGRSLEEYIRGENAGELTDAQSVEVIRQILCGLEAVHPREGRLAELAALSESRDLSEFEWNEWQDLRDRALVHRDIKPSNVMLTPSGRVKLIDFNIASQAGEERVSNSRTPFYTPPMGWADRVWKPQVDLYATGVVLYELLCDGKHPYPDGNGFVDPAIHRSDISDELCDVMRRSCSVEHCFVTATGMREALLSAWEQ